MSLSRSTTLRLQASIRDMAWLATSRVHMSGMFTTAMPRSVAAGTSITSYYIDGTFFADSELPGRDMSHISHPLITDSLRRFSSLPTTEREKIRFIHLNHTNPATNPHGDAALTIQAAGCHIAPASESRTVDTSTSRCDRMAAWSRAT